MSRLIGIVPARAGLALLLLLAACSSPRWAVGNCLWLDKPYEPWQSIVRLRIEAVGQRAYLVRYLLPDRSWGPAVEADRLILDHPSYYRLGSCAEASVVPTPPPAVEIHSMSSSLALSKVEEIGPDAEAHLRRIVREECSRK